MSKRFGRNQKRKLRQEIDTLERRVRGVQFELAGSRKSENETNARIAKVMRDQLVKGAIPLEVEHFLSRDQRGIILHAIFDEKRRNLHYQHQISANELRLQRDSEERERLGEYLGRAIADSLAEAISGKEDGSTLKRGVAA